MLDKRLVENAKDEISKQKILYFASYHKELNQILSEWVREEYPNAMIVNISEGLFIAVTWIAKWDLRLALPGIRKRVISDDERAEWRECLDILLECGEGEFEEKERERERKKK